jgi:hypothetical protein
VKVRVIAWRCPLYAALLARKQWLQMNGTEVARELMEDVVWGWKNHIGSIQFDLSMMSRSSEIRHAEISLHILCGELQSSRKHLSEFITKECKETVCL